MSIVKIYTTETCPYCFILKDWLTEIGVSYEEHHASEKPELEVVPATFIGEDGPFIGVDRPSITTALKSHGLLS